MVETFGRVQRESLAKFLHARSDCSQKPHRGTKPIRFPSDFHVVFKTSRYDRNLRMGSQCLLNHSCAIQAARFKMDSKNSHSLEDASSVTEDSG